MKLKNKILLILVILMAFICLNATSSFAAEETIDLSNKSDYDINITFTYNDIDFTTLNYKAFIYDSITDYYYFYVSDDNFTIRDRTVEDVLTLYNYNSSIVLELSTNNTVLYKFLLRSEHISINDDNNTITVSGNSMTSSDDVSLLRSKNGGLVEIPIYRTEGGYSPDYSLISTSDFQYVGNAVFPQPPQGTILAPIVEEVETEKTLVQVVGILPIVLIVIVSLIAIRKALQLLAKILTKA